MIDLELLSRTARTEWARIWTIRSSRWFAIGLTLAVLGFGAIAGFDLAGDPPDPGRSTAWDEAVFTAMFAMFGVTAMAVVIACADHTTGGIVPTLQWTPRRGHLFTARVLVTVVTTALLGVLLVAGASVIVGILATGYPLTVSAGVATLGKVALVLGCAAAIAVGLGLLTRSTAVALVIAIALLLVLPLILGNMPWTWAVEIAERLPGTSAISLIFGGGPSESLPDGQARTTLLTWAGVLLAGGGWRLVRSDANR
jgi:ABC-2 type transport system permease protein